MIANHSEEEINLDGYFFCSFPDYQELSDVGAVAAGDIVTITSPVGLSAAGGELGVYSVAEFSDPEAIEAYVEWGDEAHERSPVAQEAGIWDGNPLTVEGNTLSVG